MRGGTIEIKGELKKTGGNYLPRCRIVWKKREKKKKKAKSEGKVTKGNINGRNLERKKME